MIVEAFVLLTVSIGNHEANLVKYSEPMTQQSCQELERNVNAILMQSRHRYPGFVEADPFTYTRCVPVSLVTLNTVNTTVLNQPVNKINIRK